MRFLFLRMTSQAVGQRLKDKAEEAEKMIIQLKNQLNLIKQAAAVSMGKDEAEKLQKENDALKKEIEQVRMQLMVAEIKNGAKQVPLPAKAVQASAALTENETPPVADASEAAAASGDSSGKPKKEQKAKTPKEGEAKGKKAAKEADVAKVDVSRLDLRIGKIVGVKKHPDADRLYVEEVDLGEDKNRTIVSGLVNHVQIEQMQDRLAVFLCNLKPAKMVGIFSEGMIMCASTPEKVEILDPPAGAQIGDRISFDGYSGTPDALLNPKKKIWETLKPDVFTDANRVATYKGVPFQVKGKGYVTAATLANVPIH